MIGLNGVNYFVGASLEDIKKHIAHAQELGILDSLVLGTDFFILRKKSFSLIFPQQKITLNYTL